MPAVETRYEHVVLDEREVPTIAGTTMKVTELVLDSQAYGWSPEELKLQHPYLSLGEIHSALAYYWDHREDLDRHIEQELETAGRLRQELRSSPLVERLRAKGLI